jgi:hypothetical protein
MKSMAAFLADAAVDHGDGTFDVQRGGITDFFVAGIPGAAHFMMFVRVQLDATEAANLHHVAIHVMLNGQEIAPWVRWPLAVRSADTTRDSYFNLMVTFDIILPALGDGYIEAVLDDEIRLPHMQFRVGPIPSLKRS